MANKVRYGLKNVYVAFRAADLSGGEPDWETPAAVAGAVAMKIDPEGDDTKFYADNMLYYLSTSNQGYSGELEMALIPDTILSRMLGWDVGDDGELVELSDGTPEKFALLYQIEGDDKNARIVMFDCQASRPSREDKSKSEEVEPVTDVLKLTAFPIEIGSQNMVKSVMELSATNTAAYNAFFDAVPTPTFS